MAVTRRKKSDGEGKKTAAAQMKEQPRQGRSGKPSQADLSVAEAREKVMGRFHPEVVSWLDEKLGLDLSRLSVSALYDLQQGKLTAPLPLVVTPLAYDRTAKAQVEMPRIKTMASLRVILPFEKGKPVAPDKDHRIFVQTVPCRPFIERSDSAAPSAPEGSSAKGEEQEPPKFTDAQLMALEGVGIERDRMFGGYNAVPLEIKHDMAAGGVFPVSGTVRTDFGYVNVVGEAKLVEGPDGSVRAAFETSYPEERKAGMILDLMDARKIGTLELDFFRRSQDGLVITNADGLPVINQAGMNLLKFGMAMEPVRGFQHHQTYDAAQGRRVDKIETAMYQVSAVNGSLFATRMKEIRRRDELGKEYTAYEVPDLRMKDGKVFVDGRNSPLEFVSERDLFDYKAGRGGLVSGASFRDSKTGKETSYEAFVVPSNARSGYGYQFSPSATKEILEIRDRKVTARKKQNFGIGI